MFFNGSSKGFTFVEIMVSSMLLAIVAAAVYATMIAQMKMTTSSRNDLEAHMNAAAWLERVRATVPPSDFIAESRIPLNDAASILDEDYATWPLANKVNNLVATYNVEEMELSSGATFSKPLKITVKVVWEEKDVNISRKVLR